MKRLLLIPLLFLLGTIASAQNTVTLTAAVTSGNGVVTPVLTWDTAPLATDCLASGGWSGNKGGAGSEMLADITSSATYNLDCTWDGGDTASLTWTLPTENEDGSAYTDQNLLTIYASVDGGAEEAPVVISNPLVTSRVLSGRPVGDNCFEITATNLLGVESQRGGTACKTITGTVQMSESIGITVNPIPNSPSGLGVT